SRHHILIDGWSTPLLVKEVFALYEAYSQGKELRLDRPRPYGEYISWLERQDRAAAEAFWRAELGGFSAPTPFRVDHVTPGEAEYADEKLTLSDESSAAIQAFARTHKLTVSTLLQAAWGLLLARYSGEDDVLFGVTVSGRSAPVPGIDRMVGLFINTLPVRVKAPGEATVATWLAALHQRQTVLRDWEHTPLVEVQGWSDVPRGTALFESLVVFENYPVEEALKQGSRGLTVGDSRTVERSNFPITLLGVVRRALTLHLSYDRRRFDDAVIRRMLGHLEQLLQGFVSRPDAHLADLTLLSADERRHMLVDLAGPRADSPRDRLIHELVAAQAQATPDAIALVFEGKSLTYRDFDRRVNQLAHALVKRGVGPEVIVGVCLDRSLELPIALHAVLRAGGAYLPLDPEYPHDRLAFMLDDAKVPVLLTQSHLEVLLPSHRALVLRLDTDWTEIEKEPDSRLDRGALALTNLAYVIYTSGSTGRPKGAMNEHRGILNRLQWMQQAYGLTGADRVLQKTPFSFDVSVWEFFWPLMFGATLVVAKPEGHKDPGYLAELIRAERITTLHFVPSMLAVFLAEPGIEACSSLTRVFASGEALLPAMVDGLGARLPGAALHNLYGPTEAAVDVTAWACQPGAAIVPIGKPIANVQIYLLDPRREPVPEGVPGELFIGGVQVARGYLNRPELTADRFVVDSFAAAPGGLLYRTGDLARWLPDGAIEYLGRIDHQVKLRGFRIELGEIEAAIAAQPGVREVVVVVREDNPGDRRLVAYFAGSASSAADLPAIRAALGERLPAYMVPSAFVVVDALPLTSSGKIDRKALPAPEASAAAERVYVAPRDAFEDAIAGIYAEVLKLPPERVGAHDGFFALGGHSLLATQAISRIRASFGIELPLGAVFEASTPAELGARVADALRAAQGVSAPPLARIAREGQLAASFGQERLWFLAQLDPDDVSYNIPLIIGMSGALDAAALARVLAEIVRRHEVLRTTFATVDGRSLQVVHDHAELPLPITDLSAISPADRDETVRRAIAAEMARPFDLAHGPVIRARLLALADDDHVLVLITHHIVADAWTRGILNREIAALYAAFVVGGTPTLPELPIQYADYAAWQRAWMSGPTLDAQLAYWKQRLDGAPRAIELPTDRARPAVRTNRGERRVIALSPELTRGLKELARREGVTLFMTLLAGFDVLLHRITRQGDIVVGSPIAGRTRAETEGLIGFFLNTLVLRTELADDLSFKDLLARVKAVCLGAYAHQDLPFERLVQEIAPERDLSRTPIFQVIFNLQNTPVAGMAMPGLALRGVAAEVTTTKVDLTLIMREEPGGLVGSLSYSTDLFDGATVDRMLAQLRMLLEGAVKEPARPLGELALYGDDERQKLLVAWNDTAADFPLETRVHELFEDRVDATPDALALVAGGARLTFRELEQRSNRLANHLRKRGVGPDVVVGLLADRSAAMVVGLLGILKAGGAYVPLDPTYPKPRLAQILGEAGSTIVVTAAASLAVGLDAEGLALSIVRLDADADALAAESDARPDVDVADHHLAYVLFTSGSTGKPKGVAIEHRQLVNYVRGVAQRLALPAGASYAHISTFAADLGNTVLFPPLCLGGTL
ncbi:MAG: amino acid adenylation domain-containing protein, partial [Byssovorax sp.]